MAEVTMNVKLLSHTQLSDEFVNELKGALLHDYVESQYNDSKVVALTAIRSCYSAEKPSLIVINEGEKYFGQQASDGESGTEADRLLRMIFRSKHLSTVEHLTYTFAIEGVSRALLAQLTRHRVGFSFSVQSQRYVKFGSGDKSQGFDYVVPDSVTHKKAATDSRTVQDVFEEVMQHIQEAYDCLREAGIPAEDCRALLPNAAATNLTMTVNLRALLDFYAKRKPGRGAQGEIAQLAERLREEVVRVDPWTDPFFDAV
jgi:thymidylate synthase (FAD)